MQRKHHKFVVLHAPKEHGSSLSLLLYMASWDANIAPLLIQRDSKLGNRL